MREDYGKIAAGATTATNDTAKTTPKATPKTGNSCCGPTESRQSEVVGAIAGAESGQPSGASGAGSLQERSSQLGYSAEELNAIPEGANLGLGCGNPQAIAALKEGETVLDLGSGAGFDCFLAARQVGETGQVLGVDMTHEMRAKARENAREFGAETGAGNVSFRLGEIEHLPVADASVNAIISNCVINLSPDKPAVYAEAFRVLKPGGRLAISDIVVTAPLPEDIRNDMALYTGCVAGASTLEEVEALLEDAGFEQRSLTPKGESREFIRDWVPGKPLENYVVSASIQAVKPLA